MCKKLLEDARNLQRNVVFSFMHCPDEKTRYSEALSLREDIEILREFIGLTGWQRVVIVGSKRDEMRSAFKRAIKPEEVSESLKTVRWGPGREVSPDVAEKLLALYDKFSGSQFIIDIIIQGQRLLGRNSPFDEYSKLSIVAGRAGSITDIVWVMANMIEDQRSGKVDSFAKADLQKKHGPISVYLTRKRILEGLTEKFLVPARTLAKEMVCAKPGFLEVEKDLQTFQEKFQKLELYLASKDGGETPTSGKASNTEHRDLT